MLMFTKSRQWRSESIVMVLGVLSLHLAQACTTPPTRYRLQLEGNPHAQAGRACIHACNARREDRFECYGTCPGVEVVTLKECGSTDRPPNAICAEQRDGSAVGILVAGVLGLVVLVVALTDFNAIVPVGRGDPSG